MPELAALAPARRTPHEREPARERRRAPAPSSCRTSATTPSRWPRRHGRERGDPGPRRVPARRHRAEPADFRLFGPDETASNRLGDVFEVTGRTWLAEIERRRRGPRSRRPRDGDPVRAPLPGLARGLPADRPPRPLQLLRGLHPHRRLDVQPAREVAEDDARTFPGGGRSPRSTTCSRSHVWRQDHNGFWHQDPGFIDHVVNKKAEVIRVYLPPDANTLLSVADHCLRSRNYVNVIVAGKQPALDYLSMDDAIVHCTRGLGHLGVGEQRRGRRAGRRARLRRRRPDAGDPRRRRTSSASTCPSCRCASSTSST